MVLGSVVQNLKLGPMVYQNIGPGVTSAYYIDHALRPFVVPHFGRHGNHVFHQDSARAHNARATRNFLREHGIQTLQWRTLSPDLNPIEQLWDKIQRRLNDMRKVDNCS